MVKSMDVIVREKFPRGKPHGDMLMLGYKFLCAHISITAFIDADLELDTDEHEIIAVEQQEGVNFYAREDYSDAQF